MFASDLGGASVGDGVRAASRCLSAAELAGRGRVDGAMAIVNPPPTLQQRLNERTRPDGPVVMLQRWEHLLFLHWRYEAAIVQASLPPGLTVDTWDGSAWLGIVPLFMRDVRPRFVPAIPAISDFYELNLRTYVYDAMGRPGVYFHSLDCNQPLAVEAARRMLGLRYEHCAIEAKVEEAEWVDFSAERAGSTEAAQYRYRSYRSAAEAEPDTLDFFLLERYRLFAADNAGAVTPVRICHAPYRTRKAHVTRWSDVPIRQAGFEAPGREPDHICATDPVELEVFAPEAVV